MKFRLILLGIAIMLMGLYGGAYVLHSLPAEHWSMFPNFMAAGILTLGGMVTIAYGAAL